MTIPSPGTVCVRRFDLDRADADFGLLTDGERARAGRLHFAHDRRRWAAGRCLLRRTLGACLGADPAALEFGLDPFGKPRLLVNSPLCFNVSHSGALLLLAFAWDQEVGVDAERLRSDFVPEELAAQVFSPREQEALRGVPQAGRHAAFLSLWTAKEAYVKALGTGLSFPLPLLSLTLNEGTGCYAAEDRSGTDCPLIATVRRLPVLPGFAASLAAAGAVRDIEVVDEAP